MLRKTTNQEGKFRIATCVCTLETQSYQATGGEIEIMMLTLGSPHGHVHKWVARLNSGRYGLVFAGSKIKSWIQKSNHGFKNQIMDSKIKSWIQKSNHGFKK